MKLKFYSDEIDGSFTTSFDGGKVLTELKKAEIGYMYFELILIDLGKNASRMRRAFFIRGERINAFYGTF